MRKATAFNAQGVQRATHEIAEEAARRAGVSLGDWLDGVVSEQAAHKGVSADDLNEEDKLDAIGERLLRLSRRAERPSPAKREEEPRAELFSRPVAKPSPQEIRIAQERLDAAVARFESRAAKNEQRTAKAFESVASWIERDQAERLEERETLQTVAEKLAAIESRSQRDAELLRATVARNSAREDEAESRIAARLDELARRIATSERSPREERRPARPAPLSASPSPDELRDDRLTRRTEPKSDGPRGDERSEPKRVERRPVDESELDVESSDFADRKQARFAQARRVVKASEAEPRRSTTRAAPRAAEPDIDIAYGDDEPAEEFEPAPAPAARARRETLPRQAAPRAPSSATERDFSPASRGRGGETELEARLDDLARRVTAAERAREPSPSTERPKFDVREAVEQIARRRAEAAPPARPAPVASPEPGRSGWRHFGVDSERAPSPAPEPAARPSVETLREEMAALEARLERMRVTRAEPKPPATDALALRDGLASMSRSLADLAPRNASVALEGAVGDFGQRLNAARDAGASERWVAPVEAMAKQVLEALRERDPRAAAAALEREIRALSAKIDALANASVEPDLLRRLRAQMDETRVLLAAAATNPVPVERLERQIGHLADRVERLAASPSPHAEMAQILQLLAETHAQIEQSTPATVLNAIEKRLEHLAVRVDDAIHRPAPVADLRPLEELARRVDGMRASLERQAGDRPDLAPLEFALREINAKLDRAPREVADSKVMMTTLQGLGARLEETLRQPRFAQTDPQPLEDLARRIDGVRATVERQSDFGSHAAKFEAALGDISAKLDRAPPPSESPALQKTLRDLTARLEEAFRRPPTAIDPRPLDNLSRRLDDVRQAIERQAGSGAIAPELRAALGELGAKLDRVAASPAPFDPKPLEDLARRIDAVRATVERLPPTGQDAAELKTGLRELGAKFDRLAAAPVPLDARPLHELGKRIDDMRAAIERRPGGDPDAAETLSALRLLDAKLDRLAASPIPLDPRPVEDLARRIDSVRASVERQGGQAPAAAELKASMRDMGAKLDRLAAAPQPPIEELGRRIDSMRAAIERRPDLGVAVPDIQAALREIGAKLDRVSASPASLASQPLEDLARQIEAVRSAVERQGAQSFDASDLHATMRDIGAKLDQRNAAPMTLDPAPLEDLGRRIESVRAMVERQGGQASSAVDIKTALHEIAAKLDRQGELASLRDPRALDDIARGLDDVRATLSRSADRRLDAGAIETTLKDISAKLDRQAIAPIRLDPTPLDDLARRIEGVRATVERQAGQNPDSAEIKATLSEIRAKLDRQAASAPHSAGNALADSQALENIARGIEDVRSAMSWRVDRRLDTTAMETTLNEISAKLDRQAEMPFQLDPRPLEELARRIDDVRVSVERQAEREPDTSELRAALRDIGAKLDRPAASHDPKPLEDLGRRIEAVRASVERQAGLVPDIAELRTALQDVGAKLDRPAAAHDPKPWQDLGQRIEAVRASVERHAGSGPDFAELQASLRGIGEKLDRHAAPVAPDPWPMEDLARRIDDVRASVERRADPGLDGERWEAMLREISGKLDAHAISSEESRALIEVVQELASRVDREPSAWNGIEALEPLLRDLGEKQVEVDLTPIESALRELSAKVSAVSPAQDAASQETLASLESLLGRISAKLDDMPRGGVDAQRLEHAILDLREEITQRSEPQIDARLVEQAADMLAKRIAKSGVAAFDTEALVNQISDIHGRLDTFDLTSSSHAALERTVSDLIEELETTRNALQVSTSQPSAMAPLANGIMELRAEQANSDRRMESRLFSVQGILEKLVDRLARLEDHAEDGSDARTPRDPPSDFGTRPSPAKPAPASASAAAFNLRNIPDRDGGAPRRAAPAAARPIEAPGVLLEPGAGSPSRNAAINAHIAAARRAAQTAMAEHAEKAEPPAPEVRAPKLRVSGGPSAIAQAGALFVKHRRPILLGATAAALTVAATVAMFELRGGHPKEVQKSELPTPTDERSPLAEAPATSDPRPKISTNVDNAPTGSVDANPAKPAAVAPSPQPTPGDLVASLPTTLPQALRDAAQAGQANAETEVALRYLEGRTVPRDAKTASRWLELAASQDQPIAEYRLAALYEKGIGVARDAAEARAWYLKAASAGNGRAMHNLAVLLAQDAGAGKPDYAQAAQWFRRAADLGVRDSQYNLGVLCGRGLGLTQDLSSSWLWFSLAARQGDADAGKKRDEVAAKMDAAATAAATKALADFRTQPLDPKANELSAPAGGWDAKPSAPQAISPAGKPGTKAL